MVIKKIQEHWDALSIHMVLADGQNPYELSLFLFLLIKIPMDIFSKQLHKGFGVIDLHPPRSEKCLPSVSRVPPECLPSVWVRVLTTRHPWRHP